jgi:hypothetical protein
MKERLLLLSFLLFPVFYAFAQDQETVFEYSGLKLTGIWGGPAYGLTPLGEDNVFYRGGFGGLEFNKSLFIAYASYWLDERVTIPEYPNQRLDFSYKGALLSYAYRSHKTVHPKVSCLIGGGKIDLENEDDDNVFILQPSAGVEINVFKWWHIDILGGYRIVTNTDLVNLSDQTMSAFQAEVKLRFGISWGWR